MNLLPCPSHSPAAFQCVHTASPAGMRIHTKAEMANITRMTTLLTSNMVPIDGFCVRLIRNSFSLGGGDRFQHVQGGLDDLFMLSVATDSGKIILRVDLIGPELVVVAALDADKTVLGFSVSF